MLDEINSPELVRYLLDKYKVLKEDSESIKMVEKLNANICFVNGVYLEMKRIEEEKEKLKEEQQKGEIEESQ